MQHQTVHAALIEIASSLHLALSQGQVNSLVAYLALLRRWNATYNLTAVRDTQAMLTQHLADCLAAVIPLKRHIADAEGVRVLDVGSGGGLPGLVFAVTLPNVDLTCVDTVGKKAAFIRQAAGELRLRNLHAEHARVEQLKTGTFDVIASRAFASLTDFARLTGPLLSRGGVWMAMKGKSPADEIAQLPTAVEVFHVEQLQVPGLEAERCLIWMRPAAVQRQVPLL